MKPFAVSKLLVSRLFFLDAHLPLQAFSFFGWLTRLRCLYLPRDSKMMDINYPRIVRDRHAMIPTRIDFSLLLIKDSLKRSHFWVVLLLLNFIAIVATFFCLCLFYGFYTVESVFVYYRDGNVQNFFSTCRLISLRTWRVWHFGWSAGR